MNHLSAFELDQLVDLIHESHGISLTQFKFIEVAISLFEDIPGLELMASFPDQIVLDNLWRLYRERKHS